MSEILWTGLFFLWILTVLHYIKSLRRWRKEDRLRREERLEKTSDKVEDETVD
jgi:hypothetical protein